MNDAIRMQISAFVDGELPDNEADLLLRRMGQDAELRQKVAEYLAIGRVMRGEAAVAGADRIHERVSAEIDDKPLQTDTPVAEQQVSKKIRPLAGFAVAATVALVGIFGLQQITGVDGTDEVAPEVPVAVLPVVPVPQQIDDQLRQYYLSHGAENGVSGINSRFVTLRLNEEALPDADDEEDPAIDEPPEATDTAPTQP